MRDALGRQVSSGVSMPRRATSAWCPCMLSITVPLNASSSEASVQILAANFPRTSRAPILFSVSARDRAVYVSGKYAVHRLQITTYGLVRVEVAQDDVRVHVAASIKSRTCPSLLPEHSVSVAEEGEGEEKEENLRSLVPRIVGGDVAHPGLVPYLARITSPAEKNWIMCSGVLISPLHVLTAAHCLPSTESTVYVGLSDSSDMSPRAAYAVDKVEIPPQFGALKDDSSRFRYDIAVITLMPNGYDDNVLADLNHNHSSATATKKWMKVNVNDDIPKTWSIVRVAGYGNTIGDKNEPSNSMRTLYQVDLPLVSAEYCEPMYGGAVDYKYQMCAGYVGQGGCDSW